MGGDGGTKGKMNLNEKLPRKKLNAGDWTGGGGVSWLDGGQHGGKKTLLAKIWGKKE